ncbi:unnamed protein product [Tilletia controversa]|nr:unnamed protein product [Tilletia controversa]
MAEAYAAHILSRVQADIDFLESTGQLRTADALIIRQTLASSPAASAAGPVSTQSAAISAISARAGAVTSRFAQLAGNKRSPPTPPVAAAAAAAVASAPATPQPQQDLVRANWSYAAAAGASDELSFVEGDTIVIVERTSADWWKGYVASRPSTALLFPSNYVEPIASRTLPPAYGYSASTPTSEKQQEAVAYTASGRLIPKARFSSGGPPPPPVDAQGGKDQAQAGPSGSNGVGGLTPVMTEEQKQKKNAGMKRLGGTMANGAAGGVGFGVGVGLINAIF